MVSVLSVATNFDWMIGEYRQLGLRMQDEFVRQAASNQTQCQLGLSFGVFLANLALEFLFEDRIQRWDKEQREQRGHR